MVEAITAASLLGYRPHSGRFTVKNAASKRKLPLMEILSRRIASSSSMPKRGVARRVEMRSVKVFAMELTKEAYIHKEKERIPRSWNYLIDLDTDRKPGVWPPENKADNPSLHNPLLRQERMGCGWLGAIFEWEGVVIEGSPELEKQAWLSLSQEEGKSPPPAFILWRIEGMKNEQAISEVLCWSRDPAELRRLASRKEEIYQSLLGGIYRLRSGSWEFVNILMAYKIPMALVSTRPRKTMETAIQATGIEGCFSAIVAAEDVHRGKPDPEMFLYAAQLLSLIPERCIVFGNSNLTVEAAHDVHMKCVAVASKHPVYELGAADLVVRKLDELSIVDLKNLADIESPEFQSSEPELEMEEEEVSYSSKSVAADDIFCSRKKRTTAKPYLYTSSVQIKGGFMMALISQAVVSYCINSETVRCEFALKEGTFANDLSSLCRNSAKKARTLCLDSVKCGSKRWNRAVVAASPPTEDAVIATEPLTKEDLVGYLASGCKPKEKWRIGTEHEKFGFEIGTLRPMTYEQIAELLNSIAERFDWDKILEGDNIIALKQGKQSISLEPGGQFELSGAPLETLHQTCAEVNSHLYQVKAVAEEMGIGFLGSGFQPKWRLKDIPIMPKGRYEIMRNYMPKVGSLGLDMMFRTCTVQVNLDFSSEADMARKFCAGLALQPIATALFANSPFTEGKPNGYLSMRSHVWTDTDKNRSGMLPFVFDDGFGFEQYVDYALDVPMYFVYRKKKYIDCAGMSFRDFMEGKLPALPGELPTFNDWENHLTTIFPEVRLKRYLEMRGADGGPWRRLCALPAFWVGLLYDEVSLQSVLDMTADWTKEEREMLRNKVPKTGLKTPFRDGFLGHVAEDVLKLAKDGLERRGFKEVGFLNEVAEVVRTGVTPAEKLLEMYHGKWGQSFVHGLKTLNYAVMEALDSDGR
ncbi:hypothetical protein Nepgr_011233 [Nepenthes gracilis]|uniref:Glutamate--cysteine ligase, chloroplastic n=1 Tax=Nepenthes gracilis TaxID=150966 RepID=A0AAD3SEU2_NEPGR|nr:hypothetical protein Nepgr_011233 [Nepenthes gracilis]